jgi:hypothetical protein
MAAVIEAAARDAEALAAGGCDAIIVENMGDLPYLRGQVYPETVAAMTLGTARVVQVSGLPCGVQVLAGANREALGVAVAAGARFVRAEAFAYAHVADEGWLDACAGELLRARRGLGADPANSAAWGGGTEHRAGTEQGVAIWADVQKKHAAHAVTGDLSLADLASGAAFSGADALVVTGSHTGASTNLDHVRAVKSAGLPVAVGSGVTPEDAARLATVADALIVGSWIKVGGDWRQPVDRARVATLRAALDAG